MQRGDRYPEDYEPERRSRPGSRRNSSSLSRKNSITKENERRKTSPTESVSRRSSVNEPPIRSRRSSASNEPSRVKCMNSVSKEREAKKKSTLNTAPCSSNSTPKKVTKQLEFIVTGKQLLKRLHVQYAVSDFEDTNSKYGIQKQPAPIATSTPKSAPKIFPKSRSASLHSQMIQKVEASRRKREEPGKKKGSSSSYSCSRDSFVTSSVNSNYRYAPSTELDYSSVSPEYSGQSSADMSPKRSMMTRDEISSRSQELQFSSCCVSTWQECSESTAIADRTDGEWSTFWANYNNSIATVPMKNYYDQCPTPYRTENIDLADLDFSETSKKRSPDDLKNLSYIIRNEGLHLSPRETQNIIKCAHILGNVLSKAIERRSKEKTDEVDDKVQEIHDLHAAKDSEVENKKKNLTLNLRETVAPLEVTEETKQLTVTTQTDISLPNTKTAPKIFEKILRQLSKTSLEENLEKKNEKVENGAESKDDKKDE
ncbi:uncharacterized protein LOC113228345 [Hyposmocoma kahamanoa]|uniref:uncharacterized protein LOC113228345 n=1 Tax=Hyposmocoma kahamanoa TaxID=1477025 RepID=UPI000E6D76B5|nr:uncharacterized protein LOC113228345 [Hyposmocoma kahamanoa]